jgi:2-C-methyl-D-erythritol 2,4-cyclodiphosphate synthase
MDALLGAAALGDIGKHFPDNNANYKDADSINLLEKVYASLEENGYNIVNIDCTVIAQSPKLAPFIEQMRWNIAAALQSDIGCISIKATTEEGMGFTGTKEGICAHAVCLIE